jgi:glycosyltransferase involved in cell wall biosynthesis
MKILHVVGSLDQRSGGPLRAVLDLSAMTRSLGLYSEIIGLAPLLATDNPFPVGLIHAFPTKGPASYGYSPDMSRWCRENVSRFDGVMLHGLWSYANWAVSRRCVAAGVPYIVFPHGMLDLWPVRGQGRLKRLKKEFYWHWREKRVIAKSCGVFFTLSRELANARMTFTLPQVDRLIVVPYGVGPLPGREGAQPSVCVKQSDQQKVALFLGRIHPQKRPDLLIKAWKLAGVGPEWRLVIAGPAEPAYLAHLEGLARRYGVVSGIQFTGPVAGEDKRYLLQRAAWFLLASEHENFGVAVLEAVGSGCAIAISDQVYLADEFPAGSEILPVQTEAWACFMRERMTDDTWRNETAQCVREHLSKRFGTEAVCHGWVDSIEKVLHRSRDLNSN